MDTRCWKREAAMTAIAPPRVLSRGWRSAGNPGMIGGASTCDGGLGGIPGAAGIDWGAAMDSRGCMGGESPAVPPLGPRLRDDGGGSCGDGRRAAGAGGGAGIGNIGYGAAGKLGPVGKLGAAVKVKLGAEAREERASSSAGGGGSTG